MKRKLLLTLFPVLAITLASCSFNANTTSTTTTISYNEPSSNIPNKSELPPTGTVTDDTSPAVIEPVKDESGFDFSKVDYTTLDIVEINDLHGFAYQSKISGSTNYSLASTAYYIDSLRDKEEYDNVLLIANGDMFQGTAFSNLSHGLSVVNAMNEMNFDMMGIGNHEFDWGLETVLKYWDNNTSNGEANFPLINGNVNYTTTNQFNKTPASRVGESDNNDNILPYTIVEKSGIKVGILSYIGPQTNDINQNKLNDFYINCSSTTDTYFQNQVKSDAKKLKELGADIIVCNLHEGVDKDKDITKDSEINNYLATLKDGDNYLIDTIINGHSHCRQTGFITRADGLDLPVVQGGSYGDCVGKIELKIDHKTKKIASINRCSVNYINEENLSNQKNSKVDSVLQNEYNLIKNDIKEVYTVNTSYATREQIGKWTANIMKKYSGADVSFINTGGIRTSLPSCNVTIEELYEVNPFDNNLMYVRVTGQELKKFYNSNKTYYYFNSEFNIDSISDSKTYKLLTIDYVYYSKYFQYNFKNAILDYEDNEVFARSLMVLDMKSKGASGIIINENTEPTLTKVGWKQGQ